jgi:hypothetical protein
MSETSTSEILDRMRQHVQQHESVPSGRQFQFAQRSSSLDSYDTRKLHQELMTVHALHAAVGEINPRPPGLHNEAIQFVKKAMRRMLTWYTRPLHQFHAAVSRAFQEQARVSDTVLVSLRSLLELQVEVGELRRSVVALSRNVDALSRVRAIELAREQQAVENFLNSNIEQRLAALENSVGGLLQGTASRSPTGT